ncbi:hypothetical protein C8R45DRAFT_1137138 [Mycena sanguinolenta]|nr:hypothetical protein C8R45DRAFT_1137138 [Mycena sanguinolenta]
MASSTLPDLGPNGLVVNNKYILNITEVVDLRAYLFLGMGLVDAAPTESGRADYLDTLELGWLINFPGVVTFLNGLLPIYANIKHHCKDFYDTTFMALYTLNDKVRAHADLVQSHGTNSYSELGVLPHLNNTNCSTGYLFNLIRNLADITAVNSNSDNAQSLRGEIKNGIDSLLGSVKEIKDYCAQVVEGLTAFETECFNDKQALQTFREVMERQSDSEARQNTRDLETIDANFNDIGTRLPTVIATLQDMIGVVDAMAKDLTALQNYVNHDVRTLKGHLTQLVENNLTHRWSEIVNHAAAFRDALGAPYYVPQSASYASVKPLAIPRLIRFSLCTP